MDPRSTLVGMKACEIHKGLRVRRDEKPTNGTPIFAAAGTVPEHGPTTAHALSEGLRSEASIRDR